jgi:hypothetical protein
MTHRANAIIVSLAVGGLGAGAAIGQCTEGCTAIHTLIGEAAGDQFGWQANNLGDLDGDDINDFGVSAPTSDASGTDGGRFYVYSGAGGGELFRITGTAANAQLGFDSNPMGDADGDKVGDVLIGAPFSGAGRAFIYSGASLGVGQWIHTFDGEAFGDQFGYRVAGSADLTLDGVPDILISATLHDAAGADAGRVYVYDGADFSLVCTVDGLAPGDQLGTGIAYVGDLTDDGRAEFVIGAHNAGTSGRAYVVTWDGSACSIMHTLEGGAGNVNFGQFFVGGEKDVNNDGTPDIYVGDFSANRAHVFSGVDFSELLLLTGDGNGGFGLGEMMDDVDGDDHDDLVLAAWVSNAGGAQAGKVFIYSGRTGDILETFTHDIPGATFGFDARAMGDVDDDQRMDYVITAAWDANQRGTTYIIAGTEPPVPETFGPSSFAVGTGELLSGGLDELQASDDERVVIRQRAPLTPLLPNVRVDLQGQGSYSAISQMNVTLEAAATALPANVPQRIQLWSFETNGFETVDERNATRTDSAITIEITDNPRRFISDGSSTVFARLSWFDPGAVFFVSWEVLIDQTVWEIIP